MDTGDENRASESLSLHGPLCGVVLRGNIYQLNRYCWSCKQVFAGDSRFNFSKKPPRLVRALLVCFLPERYESRRDNRLCHK